MSDDHAIGLLDQVGDAIPVIRHDGPQVEHRNADAVLFRLLCGENRTLHQRTPRQHDNVGAVATERALAKRDHVVGARIYTLVVRLAIQVLVLEEHHRVVAPYRRAQQSRRVHCIRREHDANTGRMREDRDAGLAVIRRAAAQVAADRDADDDRA